MNIGIFETEHFEAAYPVIKLFDNNNTITIFAYQSAYRQLQYLLHSQVDNYSWVIKPEGTSKYSFIYAMFREVKKRKITVLYLDTITNNFIVYALMIFLLPNVRVIVTIHNINSFFNYKRSLSLRRLVRFIGRKILLSVVKEFNVISWTMMSYLEKRLAAGKKVHCIPGAIFEEGNHTQNQPAVAQHINIVIPGTVDGRRRDYEQSLALLSSLELKKISSTVTLLGKFYDDYGKMIWEKCKAIQHVYAKVQYYGFETVDQPEFDRVMSEANFIFIPSVINTIIDDGVEEMYGVTISSGNLFDIVKYAKPFIVPQRLHFDSSLQKSCYRYTVIEDIASFMIAVRQDATLYETLKIEARNASGNYTLEKVRERNNSLFSKGSLTDKS
jgi:hypothetical protein